MTRHYLFSDGPARDTRRTERGTLQLRRPQLADAEWLQRAVERGSSTAVAAELKVSAGTVRSAYGRVGVDPASTPRLYARGHLRERPSAAELGAAWATEGTFRGVSRRFGIAHTTAAVWLAESAVYADTATALSRSDLLDAIKRQRSMAQIAADHEASTTTVRIELHRHGLFEKHRNRHRTQPSV